MIMIKQLICIIISSTSDITGDTTHLLSIFEHYLPQLLMQPNADDPLNDAAATLLLNDKETYEEIVKVKAIQDLYRSFNSPPQLKGWKLTGGDPCQENWTVVSCVGSSVIQIKIDNLNISGNLGYQLENFHHLKLLMPYTTRINERIDVYCFGVVLLELVTGKEANEGDGDLNLAEWAWKHFGEGYSMVGALDPQIKEATIEIYLNNLRLRKQQ
ncbi:Leucine-rich repeat-containing protein [Artemisia annua]|uniref:Leucine-rich repeat-containing protein n=1 Tax=Artemisia annua TaxID=35608 RepID=A0A2U1N3R0_ARTAN|nr:Leucine-rich repeat-containing protein [Artemisia annua]